MSWLISYPLLIFLLWPVAPATASNGETVILLHGIGRSPASMQDMEEALQRNGYHTLNIGYPSLDQSIPDISQWLRKTHLTESFWQQASKVHFVTHSMGGLVAQHYLAEYKSVIPAGKMGRAVMLGPPHQGSEVADTLDALPPYHWYYGPAASELTTKRHPAESEDIWYELGIIAGTTEWPYPVAAFLIPGESDGRVSVNSTKTPGMADHTTLPATHSFIMNKARVQNLTRHFLQTGRFPKNGQED